MAIFSKETNQLYYVTKDSKGNLIPASWLDHVVCPTDSNLLIRYVSPLDGKLLDDETCRDYLNDVVKITENNVYLTTDHIIMCVTAKITNGEDIHFVHLSTDNSVRANLNDKPLYSRIENITRLIKIIIAQLGEHSRIVFCLNEVGRPSMDGKSIQESSVIMEWLCLVKVIESCTGLTYYNTYTNNPSLMSFGVAVFTHNIPNMNVIEKQLLPIEELSDGNIIGGCICLGMEIENLLVWVTHFPIDFKGVGEASKTFQVASKLLNLFSEYPQSTFAFGDFNTIHGNMSDAYLLALSQYPMLQSHVPKFFTFAGAYFDSIPDNEGRVHILEMID